MKSARRDARMEKKARQRANTRATFAVHPQTLTVLRRLTGAIRTATSWRSGYTATEDGGAFVRAYIARNLAQAGERNNSIFIRDLLTIRAEVERDLCRKHGLNADGIRDSVAVPEPHRFHLGLLDSLIGTYMLQTAKVQFVEMA
jgi:hypothetical protein